MKRPDEIKKGLECCTIPDCAECPYEDAPSCVVKNADALDYIQRLESNYSQVSKALCGKGNATMEEVLQAVSQLKADLEAVKRERDAAVIALHGNCEECRYEDTPKCASCIFDIDAWNAHDDNWQWRGVCPENTEVKEDD